MSEYQKRCETILNARLKFVRQLKISFKSSNLYSIGDTCCAKIPTPGGPTTLFAKNASFGKGLQHNASLQNL